MNQPLAIDLHHLAKTYRGGVAALRGVEMRVHRGEVFGLLGPNGAGKTTLVKIMMTVVRPTRAEGVVLDRPIGHKATLGRIGYLPEHLRPPRYLTGRQVLEFLAALSKVDRPTRRRRAGELLALVGMAPWSDRRVGTYSKGMVQRLGLAAAMMNDPELLVLDEPTDGVDPLGRRDIRDAILAQRARGRTVFINSHLLGELEMICDRVAILVHGLVARQGTLPELGAARQRYEIDVAGAHERQISAALSALGRWEDWIQLRGPTLRIAGADPAQVQPVLDALRSAGLTVARVQPMRPSLEDLFMETVNGLPSRPAPVPLGA